MNQRKKTKFQTKLSTKKYVNIITKYKKELQALLSMKCHCYSMDDAADELRLISIKVSRLMKSKRYIGYKMSLPERGSHIKKQRLKRVSNDLYELLEVVD